MKFILGVDTNDEFRNFHNKIEADELADEWVAIDAPDLETAILHYEDAFTNWQKNVPATPYTVQVGQQPILKTEFQLSVISHKEGFKSLKGKDIAYRLKDGEIEVIAVVNDTIEDYECFEVLEMDTQLPWNIPEAHFLLGIK